MLRVYRMEIVEEELQLAQNARLCLGHKHIALQWERGRYDPEFVMVVVRSRKTHQCGLALNQHWVVYIVLSGIVNVLFLTNSDDFEPSLSQGSNMIYWANIEI